MITFECDLCGKIFVYASPVAMDDDGQCFYEYLGHFQVKNNICRDCKNKLLKKEAEILRTGTGEFYGWLEAEFGKKIIGKAVQNNNYKGA